MTQEMAHETATTQEMVDADSQRSGLWFILLAGPVIYAIYFLAVWSLGEFGCIAGIQTLTFLGANPIRLGVVVFTAVAALVIVAIGIVGYRRWYRLHQGPEDPDEDDPKFMLFVGTWLNGLFAVVTLLSAVPMFLGSACDWI